MYFTTASTSTMTIFDALFLLCFFAAVVALIWAAVVALRGKDAQALMKLRTLGMSAAAYMTVVLVVALVIPRKVYSIGDMQCFDDWCITVVSTAHISDSVVVDLRLSRRAKRVPQGEKGTVVYLVDRQGRRYNPTSDREDIPFDTPLQPGESLITTRRFTVPSGVGALGLIYTHEGGFPIGSFVIGENDWFHGPPVVWLSK
jgi:hypothetical protein